MNATQIRDYVADQLFATCNWRLSKVQEYPEDERNENSYKALVAVSSFVRGQDVTAADVDVPVGLRRILMLAQALDVTNPETEMPWGKETARVASRYGFVRSEFLIAETVGKGGYEAFFEKLYEAMLDDLAEDFASGDSESLTLEIAEILGSARTQKIRTSVGIEGDGIDREVLAILRELRDLLNERLPN